MDEAISCPACGSGSCRVIYEVDRVPTNSCVLVSDRDAATDFPHGSIRLTSCNTCGFIFNRAFDSNLPMYSGEYEATQAYSPTFNAFDRTLARQLVERHYLHNKSVLEIGCGKGEFLTVLCELGGNRGVGYDPTYVEHDGQILGDGVRIVREYFTEQTPEPPADFVCCKMTLEHIPKVSRFVKMIRGSVAGRQDSIVFFQVPDATRILQEGAFWDVYYEHCSYFTPNSLSRLFANSDFHVRNVWTDYDDQYLMIEASPASPVDPLPDRGEAVEDDFETVRRADEFAMKVDGARTEWQQRIQGFARDGLKTVLWGSGSKAVGFLTTLTVADEIEYVVDINPHRAGRYMPGCAQKIVEPEFLRSYQPDVVVVMNPIYRDEVAADLESLNCASKLLTV